MSDTIGNKLNTKLLLCGAFGHLLCWLGGDLLLYFMPSGPLNVMGLFDYNKTVEMLQGVSSLQFTLSGVFGVIAMMVIMPGYFQIANFLKTVSPKSACIVQIGTALTCVAGAVMHFTCTSMLWHFVKAGATEQAHEIMLSFFFETAATSAMCNIGVFMVCVTLFVTVFKQKTCLPKWACLINTIPFTMVAAIIFAGMGAMNVGSSMMFFGLYFLMKKYNKPAQA
ncbi:MAG: DUF6796 family protein [Acetivibrionales bacterium]|jgi:hypothetical protein